MKGAQHACASHAGALPGAGARRLWLIGASERRGRGWGPGLTTGRPGRRSELLPSPRERSGATLSRLKNGLVGPGGDAHQGPLRGEWSGDGPFGPHSARVSVGCEGSRIKIATPAATYEIKARSTFHLRHLRA